jgi:heavy metal sensor kinase
MLGTAAATVAIFVVAAGSLYFLTRRFVISEFDRTLRAKVQAIVSLTEFDLEHDRLDADDALKIPEFQPGKNAEYFEITSGDGRQVVRSPSLGDRSIDRAGFITLPDGRRGRALRVRAQTAPDEDVARGAAGPGITITVAKATAEVDRLLGRLRTLLAVVCGLATLSLLVLSGYVIRRGLRPLDRLARGIAVIGADDLGERFAVSDLPRELSPIVSRLNDLLERLQSAFEREKCFTADAAHELRTPLAGVQAALEVCGRERRDAREYERVVNDCLRVVRRMNAMIDSLLLLARADSGQEPLSLSEIDLAGLLHECWSRYQPLAENRRVTSSVDVPDGLMVRSDREKLTVILNNLLENAAHYVDDSGTIEIVAAERAGRAVVTVGNSGSRVRPEDCHRIFDRFWRGDAARSTGGGRHCGLGLSVCRKLASVLGAAITVRCEPAARFVADLNLPDARRIVVHRPVEAVAV